MRVALYQGRAEPLDLQRNLRLIDQAAAEASGGGAELLVTPELFATGYAPALIREHLSERDVSEAAAELGAIAARHDIGLVYSLPSPGPPERRGIASALVDNAGEYLVGYQKVQLFGPEEKSSFEPGVEPPPVIAYRGLKIGLLVCYDVEFPELVRVTAEAGAELIVVPTALPVGSEEVNRILVPARALENRVTIAYANHTGTEADLQFSGDSVVAGPTGELITGGTEPQLVFADVTPAPPPGPEGPWYLQDRRVELYQLWAQPSNAHRTAKRN